eukprot:2515825-Amphidinium_carterae.1
MNASTGLIHNTKILYAKDFGSTDSIQAAACGLELRMSRQFSNHGTKKEMKIRNFTQCVCFGCSKTSCPRTML